MANSKITNIDELRVRIATLKLESAEKEVYFSNKLSKVSRAINHPISFLKSLFSFSANKEETNDQGDWVTNLAQIALPYLLNQTILRKSGFIMKSVISFLSLQIINAQNINQNILATWLDKLMIWVEKTREKSHQNKTNDFGIPPDSETSAGKPVHD